MVCIKIKSFLILLIISILVAVAVASFTQQTKAEQQRADLIFAEEPSYTLVSERTKNNKIIGWSYQIFVKIQNIGNKISDLTTVNITDDEGFTLSQKLIIEPNETKTAVFNWSTITKKDHNLFISYYPADLDTEWNKYNRAKTQMIIKMLDEDDIRGTSTPGFELLSLLLSLVSFVFILKKYRK